MARALEVIRAHRTAYGARITVEATRDASTTFDSFLGERTFWLDEGQRLTIRVKGRDWQRGDQLSMPELVRSAWQWANIPWFWN